MWVRHGINLKSSPSLASVCRIYYVSSPLRCYEILRLSFCPTTTLMFIVVILPRLNTICCRYQSCLCKMISVFVGQMIKFLLLKQLLLSISHHNNLALSIIMFAHHCSRLVKRYPLNTDKRHDTRTNKTKYKENRQRKTYKFLFQKDVMSVRGIRIPFVINICMLRDRHKHEETRRVDKLRGKKTEQSERMRGGNNWWWHSYMYNCARLMS